MHTTTVSYQDDGVDLEGFVAYPTGKNLPLVILCHAWRGRDDFICEKAQAIAKLGYVGFALDMYGKGVLGKSKEQNISLKKPFIENRYLLQNRVLKAFEVACNLSYIDKTQVAVLGFGFGGICALDLARSGINLRGTVSIYGHFDPPPVPLIKPIQGKILILHGYNDPITPQNELDRFEKELNDLKIDWQAHIYGNTMHAFSTPGANDPDSGILYNSASAKRAWVSVCSFLDEIFTRGDS